jgi:hypothetical protein
MQLLQNKNEIKAAITLMHPVARIAAKRLAIYLLENPEIINNGKALNNAFFEACAFAIEQEGWDIKDEARVQSFFENHSEAIINVSISIFIFTHNQAAKRRKWGWMGKAVAFVAGAAVASFFG